MVTPTKKLFVYGTSGFRADASLLEKVVYRTSVYAAYRAKRLKKAIGLMITASHNPIADNGVKLVDWNGRMLPMECEQELTEMVNAEEEEFERIKAELAPREEKDESKGVIVVVATDTRPSSPMLLTESMRGICSVTGVHAEMFENHTTPQLHFIVFMLNDKSHSAAYVSRFRGALAASMEMIPFAKGSRYSKQLFVDCANGVGALWVGKYLAEVDVNVRDETQMETVVPVEATLINTDTKGTQLNDGCGADFVKINARLPANFEGRISVGDRCASLDGDADRLVYFYPDNDGRVTLLDGDHIAALFAHFIVEQLNGAKQMGKSLPLSFGIVQTAYANGNSTRYFADALGVKPIMVKTGVKYLEEAAHKFDIGVYFEANGHGTVCFSDKFYSCLNDFKRQGKGKIPKQVRLLALFSQLVNEVVGDGIADLIAVECLLRYFDWSIQDWLAETYTDIPNVQLKVPVHDRSIYATAEDSETVLMQPTGLQAKIDVTVAQFEEARAFIRPSGTEQIVRIYAEAKTEEDALQLARLLEELVKP